MTITVWGDTLARIRSVKPEFWSKRALARKTSRDARLLYVGLWNLSDEHGRLLGDPRYIKGQVFPYDDDLGPEDIERLLDELEAAGKARRYTVDEDPYLFLPNLAEHQRLEPHKVPSRLPVPPPEMITPDDTPPEPGTDSSVPRAHSSEPRADLSEPRADESEWDAEESALLYVAGGREHVAGSRGSTSVLAVGELTDRNARAYATAPSAQPEDLLFAGPTASGHARGVPTPADPPQIHSAAPGDEFLAWKLIAGIPRYRDAPRWFKRHMVKLVAAALAVGFGPDAITGYAVMVISEARYRDHQHIPELRSALARLSRDAALGSACMTCGFDPGDCSCHLDAGAADRPWTADDQADLDRALEHLGVAAADARGA